MAPFGKIYSFMPNGRVFKIMAAAKLNNLEIEVADYQHMVTNKSAEFLEKFPLGKVPAFEGVDGLCLFESDAIARYIASSGPFSSQVLGSDAVTSAQIQQWVCFTEGEIYQAVLELVMWRVGMCPFEENTESKALDKLERSLSILEGHLKDRVWLVGPQLTLADLTAASALVWAFMHIIDEPMREEFRKTTAWYLRVIGTTEIESVFGPPNLIRARRTGPTC
ncbi:eEF-1B gamma subunit-like protein, partial [Metarhizium majus ARSEF 297]